MSRMKLRMVKLHGWWHYKIPTVGKRTSPRQDLFCDSMFSEMFSTRGSGGRINIIISDKKPTDDDEYYGLHKAYNSLLNLPVFSISGTDGFLENDSPWPYKVDKALIAAFPRADELYFWAMG